MYTMYFRCSIKLKFFAVINISKMESRAEGEQRGIDKADVRLATDMIHDHKPLNEIIKYSKLAKNVIMSIANSLKADLA